METNEIMELTELDCDLTRDKGHKLGEVVMMDVRDKDGTVLGSGVGVVLLPQLANNINKYPDLKEKLRDIASDIHMVMYELNKRDNTEQSNN